ncbi:N-formylglutamate deformylase [Methylobacterium sp. 391_Methyba4]|uniref:N-formylglutamate deformylase n=1 Tax=Methylobacterium sp. 391_Methyba4 TaxID=3038924 RepID=UPI00241D95A6|nr:N-formylglutamate deformylase [Methylobacterium sp. 391_Methyba4]WFS09669.1 N-formylglutamate deformylase [Methylobacterium sp. 391_Methyba4]
MSACDPAWLSVAAGEAPLIVSLPHTGTEIPEDCLKGLVSLWLARKDADWWIDRLYDFAVDLGATVIHTAISRTVIDVNRDPSGRSLYPGQATTGLCPTETFDGEPLYQPGAAPSAAGIAERRRTYFDPYHAALSREIARLRRDHPAVVLYDCHAIRSVIPRLFTGVLPVFNIGTDDGRSCDPDLAAQIGALCDASSLSRVTDGRFKGGYITRSYGWPGDGVHAVQMELACRGYMRELPGPVGPATWPSPYDPTDAAAARATLVRVLEACLAFARNQA